MDQIAIKIAALLADYHNYNGFQMTSERVLGWVMQFDKKDRVFILEELLYLLSNGIYLSEANARLLLIKRIERLALIHGHSDAISFIGNAEFPLFQQVGKSQDVLLQLLDSSLQAKFGIGLKATGTVSRKHVIYIDDILATGGTVYKQTREWLLQKDAGGTLNLNRLLAGEKTYDICVFCNHNASTFLWRLKMDLKEDKLLKKIVLHPDYTIEDHRGFLKQRMNFVYPIRSDADPAFDQYLASLDDFGWTMKDTGAYRETGKPAAEKFYSSADNRSRFEHILLRKGIQILTSTATLAESQRPLGMTIPSYRTFGSGTLFFTWRNISNTSPVVFWWDKGGWLPLFPVINRGLQN